MMRRVRGWLAHLFSREGFRGPVLTLLSGSAVALAVSYLASFALVRLYSDTMFGVADYFVAVLSVLANVASLHYEDALTLPERDEDAAPVLGLALTLTAGVCLILAGLAAWPAASGWLLGVFDAEEVAPWFWLIAPTLFCLHATRLLALWLSRRKQFRLVTAGDVANKLTTTTTRLGAGLAGAGAGGLIGGFAFAQLVSTALYGSMALRESRALRSHLFRGLGRTARRFRRFALFATPAGTLNAVVTRLPTLLLPMFFAFDVVGLFGRAFTALAVPLGFVGSAIAQVFFGHAAEAHRAGHLDRLTATVHARLVMLGLFPTLALVVAGPDLFAFLFGEPWRMAGVYARYLSPWFFLASVASPLTLLFDVLERQRTDLAISIAMFVVQAAALIAGGLTGDVRLTIVLAGASGVLARACHVGLLLRLAGVRLRDALAPYARYIAFSLPGLLLATAALFADRPWLTTLAVAAGGGIYAVVVLWKDRLLAGRG